MVILQAQSLLAAGTGAAIAHYMPKFGTDCGSQELCQEGGTICVYQEACQDPGGYPFPLLWHENCCAEVNPLLQHPVCLRTPYAL